MRLRMTLRAALASILALGLLGPATSPATGATVAEVNVFATDRDGVDVSLVAGTTYEIEVSGNYFYGLLTEELGRNNGEADAECHNFANGTPLLRSAYDAALGDGALDLLVDGTDLDFEPVNAPPGACDDPLLGGDHTYTTTYRPPAADVNLRISDPANPNDNSGFLTVRIEEFVPEPPPEPEPVFVPVATVLVDAADPDGTTTGVPLVAGETYRLEASGAWNYGKSGGDLADVECSTAPGDPAWTPDRYGLLGGEDWLDLLVDGASLGWDPRSEVDPGCASTEHTYSAELVRDEDGPATLRLLDSFYKDNEGFVRVEVFLRSTPS